MGPNYVTMNACGIFSFVQYIYSKHTGFTTQSGDGMRGSRGGDLGSGPPLEFENFT